MPVKARPPVPAPEFSWTGFYAGLNAGYAWNNANTNVVDTGWIGGNGQLIPSLGLPNRYNTAGSGPMAGLQFGQNWQNSKTIYGWEADFNYLDIDRATTVIGTPGRNPLITERLEQSFLGTLRGRLGYAVADRLMLFATGGLAYGNVRSTGRFETNNGQGGINVVGANGNGSFNPIWTGSAAPWRAGYALGGGGEYAVTDTVSIKGEYLYYDLGTINSALVGTTAETIATRIVPNTSARVSGSIARVGFNIHDFSGIMAADTAPRMVLKAPPPLAPASRWAGLYVGANAGGVWDRSDFAPTGPGFLLPPFAFADPNSLIFPPPPTNFNFVPGTFPQPGTVTPASSRRASFVGGGQAGYNWQSGPTVFGIEGDIQGLKNSQGFVFGTEPFILTTAGSFLRSILAGTGTIERDIQGSLRGRFGQAYDRLLVYGTGGLAVTHLKTQGTYNYTLALGPGLTPSPGLPNPTNTTTTATGSDTLFGLTLGGGFEYDLLNNLSLGLEYRHTFYGRNDINLGTTPTLSSFGGPAPFITQGAAVTGGYKLDTDMVVARLNWRLNK
jgi:outer membrane immunogenic protein